MLVANTLLCVNGGGGCLIKVLFAEIDAKQGGILTVILASRMTGNPQISGEIFGQNHTLYMSRIGSGQNHA